MRESLAYVTTLASYELAEESEVGGRKARMSFVVSSNMPTTRQRKKKTDELAGGAKSWDNEKAAKPEM